jgi:hypothetical protein
MSWDVLLYLENLKIVEVKNKYFRPEFQYCGESSRKDEQGQW